MKKCILSAVVILALNGYAAAQTTSKAPQKPMAKTEKKGAGIKNGLDNKAAIESTPVQQKLLIAQAAADTACVPARKPD